MEFGAVADDATINTKAIQAAIDHLAGKGGGTIVIPQGVYVSGALFLKPAVNLHLDKGAVLKCSTDMANFPRQRTRIEGHFEESFTPALINASGCDGLKITGQGILYGAGRPIWDEFWKLRKAAPDPGNFPNLGLARARLALIEHSRGVTIDGVTFKDSQFWNLHLYRCQDVLVRNARFEVPDDYKQAPSTDGIDIRVRDCVFRRGNSVLTLGSEATVVRDVIVENCTASGVSNVAVLKLRSDTPQHYEDIHFRNLTLDASRGSIVSIQPWGQYIDLKGAEPPKSVVRNISFTGFKGRFGAFGRIRPNPRQTEIVDIRLKDFDVTLENEKLEVSGAKGIRFENVVVNGGSVT